MSRARTVAVAAALLHLCGAAAGAQQPEPRRWQAELGAWAQGGAVPASLMDACRFDPDGGVHPGVGGGVGGALARGPLAVEAHASAVSTPVPEFPCTRTFESGVHEVRQAGFDPGDHVAAELRLRVELPGGGRWSAFAGAGRLWPQEVAFGGGGVGYRRPLGGARRGLRVDLGWTRYRVPIRVRVQEWEGFRVVREVSSEVTEAWQDGFSARLGYWVGVP